MKRNISPTGSKSWLDPESISQKMACLSMRMISLKVSTMAVKRRKKRKLSHMELIRKKNLFIFIFRRSLALVLREGQGPHNLRLLTKMGGIVEFIINWSVGNERYL